MIAQSATRRARLIGPAPLAALVVVGLGGLAALHLRSRGPRAELAEPGRDPLTLAYLRAWVDRHPHDAAMRLRLGREQLALGRYDEAEQVLAGLLKPGGEHLKAAARLAVEVAVGAWRAAPAGTPARAHAEERVLERLRTFSATEASAAELAQWAAVAREVGRPLLAAELTERAAAAAPSDCARWRSESARDLLAAGDPRSAAERFARAYECSRDGSAARAIGLDAVAAYVAADRGAEALGWAERLADRYGSDREVLERAERIALAQDDPARARRFGARLVELGHGDVLALRRLLDLHLGAGDLDAAVGVANRLVSLAPEESDARLTAANVSTWAGRRRLALHHWMWLARRSGGVQAEAAALDLARALEDHAATAELLFRAAERGPLPRASLSELARALEQMDSPARAIAAVEDHVQRYPWSQSAWEELAVLQERERNFREALAAREEIARRFGSSLANSMRVARLQWAAGRPADALAELRRWMGSAAHGETEYWELLAELAWDQESDDTAARAYETLWHSRQIGATGVERLILLHRAAGRIDQVIRYGREGWPRVGEPRLLLLAMDEATRAGRWSDLARLADEAARAPGAFDSFPAYWMLRARLDEQAGRIAQAERHYRRALGADPGAPEARAGLIWLFVAAENRGALAKCLADWATDAEDEPALWRPFAAGLELLGRADEALAFYERDAHAHPDDAEARERYLRALRRQAP
ncbi:MAG TPA: tetratricopeptide repeat protein, partial [Myxococcaceae bacterium]|nr:tetratricopeptide repeat protein [Myxococcaceae bacterium]